MSLLFILCHFFVKNIENNFHVVYIPIDKLSDILTNNVRNRVKSSRFTSKEERPLVWLY